MYLLKREGISVPVHTPPANSFPQCMITYLALNLLKSSDNIAVLYTITFDAFAL